MFAKAQLFSGAIIRCFKTMFSEKVLTSINPKHLPQREKSLCTTIVAN